MDRRVVDDAKKRQGRLGIRGEGGGCGSRALPVATPLSRTLAKYTDPIDAKYPWLGANQNVVLAIRRTNEWETVNSLKTLSSFPFYTSPLNSMPQSSIQSNHPRYARYKSFRNLESFSRLFNLPFPHCLLLSSICPSFPFFSPFPSFTLVSIIRPFRQNFGGLASSKILSFFPSSSSSIFRVYGKRVVDCRNPLEDKWSLAAIFRAKYALEREREGEKEKGRSLVRFQFRAWTARWRKWRPRQRPRRLYRSSLSPFSLETLEFVSPPVEVNFLLPTRLLPSKRRFQPTMLPPRVVARQLASDLVRLGLNSQSRCVTRLVECPINQTTRFLVRFQMKISRGRTSLRVPAPFPIYISCTIIEAEGQWKKNRSLRRNRSRKNIRKERRGDKLVYNRPIDPSGTFRCSVVQ